VWLIETDGISYQMQERWNRHRCSTSQKLPEVVCHDQDREQVYRDKIRVMYGQSKSL
jgi:hypothetical protein